MSKLLIIADIEDKCAATPRGLALAQEMDLTPEVVAFTYADLRRLRMDKERTAEIKKQLIAERRATVEARVAKFAGENQKVKVTVVWAEHIHEWVLKHAAVDFSVVVKSRHKSETLGHTSTDWHLLRECPTPVLLVGRKKWKKGAGVLATVDLDASTRVKRQLNEEVVLTARHYAEMFDTDLNILCVIDVPTLLSDLDLVDPKTYAKSRKDELMPAMQALAAATGLPESKFLFKRGPVAQTIVSEASATNAQLVVMGTVGRKGVKGKLIGNTAEEVLALLRTDTLTLKP